jgi:hypothetical protein
MFHIFLLVLALAVGFAAGRVKNAAKLAAIEVYLLNAERTAVTDVKQLIGDIKAKL